MFGNNFNLAKGKGRREERHREKDCWQRVEMARKRERNCLISIDFLIRFHILKCASNLK